jgi:WD40 repeat protein
VRGIRGTHGTEAVQLAKVDDSVNAVAISADGRTAVSSGGFDGTVRVWDLTGTRRQARWIADSEVLAVAFGTASTSEWSATRDSGTGSGSVITDRHNLLWQSPSCRSLDTTLVHPPPLLHG